MNEGSCGESSIITSKTTFMDEQSSGYRLQFAYEYLRLVLGDSTARYVLMDKYLDI